jgi:D-sedoheptulose 7-phosphate isomerase
MMASDRATHGSLQAELASHTLILEQAISECARPIEHLAGQISMGFERGNKLLLCGNGGSAADAQHVAAEFVNRFRFERGALPAIALSTDTSILTSIGNDSAFADIFSRQVEALGREGDILVGLSTSGRSANVLKALQVARGRKLTTVGFTGADGRETMGPLSDYCLVVPSNDTPRIQECHEFIWHVICGMVESRMFPRLGQRTRASQGRA